VCGWCGEIACQHDDGTGVPIGLYHCFNQDCPLSTVGFDKDEWNRRATPPGAVEGWVDKGEFTTYGEGPNGMTMGIIKGKVASVNEVQDIPVLIVPREVTE